MDNIKVSAKSILHTKEKFLLLETTNGIRDLPGGKIEYGETILECLGRELKEELGLDNYPNLPLLHWVWTYTSKSKNIHQIMIVYSILCNEEFTFRHQEEFDTACTWIHKDEIKEKKFIPEMERFLLDLFK